MHDGFPPKVARDLRERKETVLRNDGPYAQRQAETLEALATHIEVQGIKDFLVQSLALMAEDYDNFEPREWQQTYLANLAHSPDKPPEPEEALAGLVAAGIEDLKRLHSKRWQELSQARERIGGLEAELGEATERAVDLEKERAEAEGKAENAAAEVAELSKDVEYLRMVAPSPESPSRKKPTNGRKRKAAKAAAKA